MDESTLFTDADKKPICDLLKSHAITNGYAQVGWATSVIGKKFNRIFENDNHVVAFYKSIETLCLQDAKYISQPVPSKEYDFYIKLNPDYQKLELEIEDLTNRLIDYPTIKQRAKWSFILAWIAIALSAIVIVQRMMCKMPS
jgi:hypothetical protein